jgi:hypothetical protein
MITKFKKQISVLETELQRIEKQFTCSIQKAFNSLKLCSELNFSLRDKIVCYTFPTPEEEITFFKELKPRVMAHLLFFTQVYNIETLLPAGSETSRKSFLLAELEKLKPCFEENQDLWRYYRSGFTHSDEQYFLRKNRSLHGTGTIEGCFFESDPLYSTCMDYKLAKLLALTRLQAYLESALQNTNRGPLPPDSGNNNVFSLTWTLSKSAMVEMIYAFYAAGVFNNGKATVAQIAECFGPMFNIELGDFYHCFTEIRERKISQTKMLDQLRAALIKKIDEL